MLLPACSMMAAILFALVPLCNAVPGSPPIGSEIDFAYFFVTGIIVAVSRIPRRSSDMVFSALKKALKPQTPHSRELGRHNRPLAPGMFASRRPRKGEFTACGRVSIVSGQRPAGW
ncbi:DUF4436 family protein [Mycolicibacterium setense]